VLRGLNQLRCPRCIQRVSYKPDVRKVASVVADSFQYCYSCSIHMSQLDLKLTLGFYRRTAASRLDSATSCSNIETTLVDHAMPCHSIASHHSHVSRNPLTVLTPNPIMLGIYWILLYILQIGFCLVLVLARKEETKVCVFHSHSAATACFTVEWTSLTPHDAHSC
jgi:hypothetical protein